MSENLKQLLKIYTEELLIIILFHKLINIKIMKTLYEKWSDNEIGNFGSFLTSLLMCYRLADNSNRAKLDAAFPEYFVEKN